MGLVPSLEAIWDGEGMRQMSRAKFLATLRRLGRGIPPHPLLVLFGALVGQKRVLYGATLNRHPRVGK